jgi:hypothetical protein
MELSAFLAEDRGPSVIITASILIVLSTLFVGLRYYARHLMGTPFGVQDVIVPFAWLAEVGLCVTGISKTVLPWFFLTRTDAYFSDGQVRRHGQTHGIHCYRRP